MTILSKAIVLCLDLSQSMNKRSGVKRSGVDGLDDTPFDYKAEAKKVVQEIVKDASSDSILENGTPISLDKLLRIVFTFDYSAISHLNSQHRSCYQSWKCYLEGDIDDSQTDGDDHTVLQLIDDLCILAYREVLKLNLDLESHPSRYYGAAMEKV